MPQNGPVDTKWLLKKAQDAFNAGVDPATIKAAASNLLGKAAKAVKSSDVLPTGDLPTAETKAQSAAAGGGQNLVNGTGGQSNANNLLALARSRGISKSAAIAWYQQYKKNKAGGASTSAKISYVNSLTPGQKQQVSGYVTGVTADIAASKNKSNTLYSGVGEGGGAGGGGIGGPLFENPPIPTSTILLIVAAGLGGLLIWKGR